MTLNLGADADTFYNVANQMWNDQIIEDVYINTRKGSIDIEFEESTLEDVFKGVDTSKMDIYDLWVNAAKELVRTWNHGLNVDGKYQFDKQNENFISISYSPKQGLLKEEKKMRKIKESDEDTLTLNELRAEQDRVLVEGLETIVNQQVEGKAAPYVCAFFNPDYSIGHLIIQNNAENIVDEVFTAIQNSDAGFEFWAEMAIYDGETPEYAVESYLDDNHMVLMIQSATKEGSWEVSA